jgi:hypothetical protein
MVSYYEQAAAGPRYALRYMLAALLGTWGVATLTHVDVGGLDLSHYDMYSLYVTVVTVDSSDVCDGRIMMDGDGGCSVVPDSASCPHFPTRQLPRVNSIAHRRLHPHSYHLPRMSEAAAEDIQAYITPRQLY